MGFPTNTAPTFSLIQPSTGNKIKYRPFLVGESKQLLMAVNGASSDMVEAMKAVIDTCTFHTLDLDKIPNFDTEFIFIQIRSKSVGETVSLELTCECKNIDTHVINLNDVNVIKTDGYDTKLMLGPNLGVIMRYPTTDQLEYLTNHYSTHQVFETMMDCIETVFTDVEVTHTADESRENLITFIDSLTTAQMGMIEDFYRHMPDLKHVFPHTCSKCGKETVYTLRGIENFFGF